MWQTHRALRHINIVFSFLEVHAPVPRGRWCKLRRPRCLAIFALRCFVSLSPSSCNNNNSNNNNHNHNHNHNKTNHHHHHHHNSNSNNHVDTNRPQQRLALCISPATPRTVHLPAVSFPSLAFWPAVGHQLVNYFISPHIRHSRVGRTDCSHLRRLSFRSILHALLIALGQPC